MNEIDVPSNAKYAIISAGENNRYGHPHEETLERLEEVGCKVLRTDERGFIEICARGKKVKVYGYGQPPGKE